MCIDVFVYYVCVCVEWDVELLFLFFLLCVVFDMNVCVCEMCVID